MTLVAPAAWQRVHVACRVAALLRRASSGSLRSLLGGAKHPAAQPSPKAGPRHAVDTHPRGGSHCEVVWILLAEVDVGHGAKLRGRGKGAGGSSAMQGGCVGRGAPQAASTSLATTGVLNRFQYLPSDVSRMLLGAYDLICTFWYSAASYSMMNGSAYDSHRCWSSRRRYPPLPAGRGSRRRAAGASGGWRSCTNYLE